MKKLITIAGLLLLSAIANAGGGGSDGQLHPNPFPTRGVESRSCVSDDGFLHIRIFSEEHLVCGPKYGQFIRSIELWSKKSNGLLDSGSATVYRQRSNENTPIVAGTEFNVTNRWSGVFGHWCWVAAPCRVRSILAAVHRCESCPGPGPGT